jgi:hypothetical protein
LKFAQLPYRAGTGRAEHHPLEKSGLDGFQSDSPDFFGGFHLRQQELGKGNTPLRPQGFGIQNPLIRRPEHVFPSSGEVRGGRGIDGHFFKESAQAR